MADETPETPETAGTQAAAAPEKKRNLVPILIVVGVVVLIIVGVGVWKLTSSSDSTTAPKGPPPPALSKALFEAWQSGDQASAPKDASPGAVTAMFAIPSADGDGLTFGGCSKIGGNPLPKACVWSRPGGELTMTVARVNGRRTITKVNLGPAGTTPTSAG